MTRLSVAAVLAALVGLVVSVAAAWPRQSPASSPEALPGPPSSPSSSPLGTRSPLAASESPDGERASRSAGESQRPQTRLATVPTTQPAPRPVSVAIPAIGYAARVRPVGVDSAGLMALPDDPARLGWYRYGATPIEPGSTVLAGHLDSVELGVGPLVRLREVVPGDRIDVVTSDRRTTTYVVSSVDRYDRSALPAGLFAREGARGLRMITCGGEYDADAGGYQLNLVVTGVPA